MGEQITYVGGAKVAWWWHISWPLARLTLGADAAVVEPSAYLLKWLFARQEIRWRDPDKVVRIRNGVRFYIHGEGGATSFFAGGDPEKILDQIEGLGVKVERDEHPTGWGGD